MAREGFLEALGSRVLVLDGAMGTMIYAKGVYVNQCYDALNVSRGDLIREIHEQYAKAGANILETNTFGANAAKLRPYGLAERAEEINRRGAEIAAEVAHATGSWVAGSLGPIGARLLPLGSVSVDEATELYRTQVRGLIAGGVDLLMVETISDLNMMRAALCAAREECDLPFVACATFAEEGRTELGHTPEEVVAALVAEGVSAVGANCTQGPSDMLPVIARMRAAHATIPIVAMPNAGNPKKHDDRYLYMASPEYLAEYARRFVHAGANVVGGCCGTRPEHIRAIRGMVKTLKSTDELPVVTAVKRAEEVQVDPLAVEERSPLGAKLARKAVMGNRFVCSVELNPPRGHDPKKVLASAEKLKFHGVDVVNVPDGPRASARMGAMFTALLIQQKLGMETILHYCCRDRNLLGMQSDLLGAHAFGLRNVLAITGDPPKLGDYPDVTAVYDVESIGLVRVLDKLNRGTDFGANPIEEPTRFLIGVGANPGAQDLAREVKRFKLKVDSGANFCMTQPVYQPELLLRFLEAVKEIDIPILVGILPLASHRNAEFLHNEVPGMQIPDAIRDRMQAAGSGEKARAVGIEIAQEALLATMDLVQGVYIMPPFGRVDLALGVLKALGR